MVVVMPGPAPKATAVRRNSRVGPLVLPAEGRRGDPPPWPLPGRQADQEREAWAQLWATPQAVAWERMGWTRTVARYARMLVVAEVTLMPAMLGQLAALEDRLGLTPKALRMLLWEIAPDEVAERREGRSGSVRDRLRAVESG